MLLGHLRKKTPHRSDDSLRDFFWFERRVKQKNGMKKRAKRSTHTNHTSKKMVVDLSVRKGQCKTRKGGEKKVDIDEERLYENPQIPNTIESRVF